MLKAADGRHRAPSPTTTTTTFGTSPLRASLSSLHWSFPDVLFHACMGGVQIAACKHAISTAALHVALPRQHPPLRFAWMCQHPARQGKKMVRRKSRRRRRGGACSASLFSATRTRAMRTPSLVHLFLLRGGGARCVALRSLCSAMLPHGLCKGTRRCSPRSHATHRSRFI